MISSATALITSILPSLPCCLDLLSVLAVRQVPITAKKMIKEEAQFPTSLN